MLENMKLSYDVRPSLKAVFGDKWYGPDVLPHGSETLIAVFEPESDGVRVEVYALAMPAIFFIVRTSNYELTTGSSQSELAFKIADALSSDMLGIKTC